MADIDIAYDSLLAHNDIFSNMLPSQYQQSNYNNYQINDDEESDDNIDEDNTNEIEYEDNGNNVNSNIKRRRRRRSRKFTHDEIKQMQRQKYLNRLKKKRLHLQKQEQLNKIVFNNIEIINTVEEEKQKSCFKPRVFKSLVDEEFFKSKIAKLEKQKPEDILKNTIKQSKISTYEEFTDNPRNCYYHNNNLTIKSIIFILLSVLSIHLLVKNLIKININDQLVMKLIYASICIIFVWILSSHNRYSS
jgi:hypothetical protein